MPNQSNKILRGFNNMNLRLLLPVCWMAVVLLGGCDSSQNDSGSPDSTPHHSASTTHIVEIRQMKFVPEEIEVETGDSIRWINKDLVTHNISPIPGEDSTASGTVWTSPDLKAGERFTMKIKTAGTYQCTLHPVMKGRISFAP